MIGGGVEEFGEVQGADVAVAGEVVDLGGAAEAVGDDGASAERVESGLEGQVGYGDGGVVVLGLEAEVAGQSAAALGLVDLADAEPAQQIGGSAAREGGVLVAVGLRYDGLGQGWWSPCGGTRWLEAS
ncbi:hypothetical protein ACFY64_38150 [Streptomyces collinus]|uniref:hypothetical protein n=1 Tax=Streptomyces collinus TaxID=42684 RepID=UPI0036C625DC